MVEAKQKIGSKQTAVFWVIITIYEWVACKCSSLLVKSFMPFFLFTNRHLCDGIKWLHSDIFFLSVRKYSSIFRLVFYISFSFLQKVPDWVTYLVSVVRVVVYDVPPTSMCTGALSFVITAGWGIPAILYVSGFIPLLKLLAVFSDEDEYSDNFVSSDLKVQETNKINKLIALVLSVRTSPYTTSTSKYNSIFNFWYLALEQPV